MGGWGGREGKEGRLFTSVSQRSASVWLPAHFMTRDWRLLMRPPCSSACPHGECVQHCLNAFSSDFSEDGAELVRELAQKRKHPSLWECRLGALLLHLDGTGHLRVLSVPCDTFAEGQRDLRNFTFLCGAD